MFNHVELLAFVAQADGKVTHEEVLAIRGFIESAGMSPDIVARINKLLDPNQDIDTQAALEDIAERATPWLLADAIRDAYVIAAVDGEVSAEEIRAVEGLLDVLRIPGHLRADIHRWGQRAAAYQLQGLVLMTQAADAVQKQKADGAEGRGELGNIFRKR